MHSTESLIFIKYRQSFGLQLSWRVSSEVNHFTLNNLSVCAEKIWHSGSGRATAAAAGMRIKTVQRPCASGSLWEARSSDGAGPRALASAWGRVEAPSPSRTAARPAAPGTATPRQRTARRLAAGWRDGVLASGPRPRSPSRHRAGPAGPAWPTSRPTPTTSARTSRGDCTPLGSLHYFEHN